MNRLRARRVPGRPEGGAAVHAKAEAALQALLIGVGFAIFGTESRIVHVGRPQWSRPRHASGIKMAVGAGKVVANKARRMSWGIEHDIPPQADGVAKGACRDVGFTRWLKCCAGLCGSVQCRLRVCMRAGVLLSRLARVMRSAAGRENAARGARFMESVLTVWLLQ